MLLDYYPIDNTGKIERHRNEKKIFKNFELGKNLINSAVSPHTMANTSCLGVVLKVMGIAVHTHHYTFTLDASVAAS